MKRILSKSPLIAMILLMLLFTGCAKRAIPDTIADVERAMHAFRSGEITYDELNDTIADYYIDFDHTVGEETFLYELGQDETPILYKDLEGLSLEETNALLDAQYKDLPGGKPPKVSSQVSISKPVDAMIAQQLVYTWREDTIEGFQSDTTRRVMSTRYFLTQKDGAWKIDWLNSLGGPLLGDEKKDQKLIDVVTFPYQDEAEYIKTIILK